MEKTTCLFCGVNEELPILRRAEPRHVVCRRCGFVYQNPRPTNEEMQEHYKNHYWQNRSHESSVADSTEVEANGRPAGITKLLTGHVGKDDLVVEVGCGPAAILACIRDSVGCRVLGIEPSMAQADAVRHKYGIEVRCGDIESLNLGPQKPQALILSHVLEHIYEPAAALSRLRENLADAGWLVLEVPNVLNPHPKKRLANWLAREHVYYFSRTSLTRLLVTAGFRTVNVEEANYLRIVAQKTNQNTQELKSERGINEYWRVRRAFAKHELIYWPEYALRRVRRLIVGAG